MRMIFIIFVIMTTSKKLKVKNNDDGHDDDYNDDYDEDEYDDDNAGVVVATNTKAAQIMGSFFLVYDEIIIPFIIAPSKLTDKINKLKCL